MVSCGWNGAQPPVDGSKSILMVNGDINEPDDLKEQIVPVLTPSGPTPTHFWSSRLVLVNKIEVERGFMLVSMKLIKIWF